LSDSKTHRAFPAARPALRNLAASTSGDRERHMARSASVARTAKTLMQPVAGRFLPRDARGDEPGAEIGALTSCTATKRA